MLLTLKGLIDDGGKPVSDEEAISKVVSAFNKPTAATAAFAIKKGVLSGVLASGQEQGQRAAFMLEQAMKGVPLRNLPISRNHFGHRMLNVTTMMHLGLKPKSMSLRGVSLVCTE